MSANPKQAGKQPEQTNYSLDEARKRRQSHAKFKAQCAARRAQRRLA